MAISYDDWKKQYEGLTTDQQKKYADMVKNDATATEYANRYIQEKQNAGTFATPTVKTTTSSNQSTNTSSSSNYSSNSNSSNGTNGYNGNNNSDLNNGYNSGTNNKGGSTLSDGKNGDGNTYGKFTFDADEFLDKSKFGESTGKIEVKEGSAAINQRPDYTLDTDARLQEMVNNLNTYWETNPEFFSDRETFNRQFEYNSRESDAQRALLDSYWKKAQEYKKATSYNNGSSFASDLSSGYVSESDFEALKQYNQKAYIEWQEKMQEQLNLAISNLTIPRSIDNITDALNTLVEKFNLQAGDPYNIIQGWEDMMQRTGAWDAMNQATKLYEEANSDIAKIKEIQSRYSSSTGGTQSDALIAARLQKATLPYETSLSNKLSAGQHWQSLYQTKLGTANQYAQTIQMQANEDQRIFNQKIAALGFAVTAYTTRTPEQTQQLQLQTEQIKNKMSLLQKSQENDLALYNKYATSMMESQLEYDLTDLNVTDPKQQRTNLKNVLDKYYEEYGDIIQRPESQVIEDIIEYAKANGVSLSQALKDNFITPLQSKTEYAQAVADKYGTNPTQSIQNIGDKVALVTKYPNGMMSYQFIDDAYNPKYDIKTINGKSYLVVDDGNGVPQLKYIGGDGTVLNYASLTKGLQSFMTKYEDGEFYKKKGCGYFVNEYLTDIGDSGHVGSTWESKKALCKEKDWSKLAIGSVVAYDSGATYQDDNGNTVNAGHVSIVYDYDPTTGKVYLYDVNAKGDGKVGYWETNINDPKLYGYYTPEVYKNAGSTLPDYYSNLNEYGFVDSMTGNYGQYLMGRLNNVSINRLGGDKVLQEQINNWFKYLETKGKNSDGYIDDLIPLYEEFLETGKTPSTAYMGQLGGVAEFTNQATKYSEKVGYGRNAKVNDKGYYDDLVTLYNAYIREEKIPTEAQVAAYGGLDDFYRTAKNYAKNSGYTFTPAEQTKEIEDMRNKWMTSEDYKNIQSSIDSLNNIQAMLKSGNSGYGDYTAVYLLNKLRDPDSVVREQEFANTKNIGGIPDKIFNYFQQLQNGKILNDDQKVQIYNEMNTLMKAKIETYNSKLKAYRSQALRGGDTSKIGTLYSISNKGSINFGGLTGDMQPIPHMEELQ